MKNTKNVYMMRARGTRSDSPIKLTTGKWYRAERGLLTPVQHFLHCSDEIFNNLGPAGNKRVRVIDDANAEWVLDYEWGNADGKLELAYFDKEVTEQNYKDFGGENASIIEDL